MNKSFYILFFVFCSPTLLFCQIPNHGQCGVTTEMTDINRLIKNKQLAKQLDLQPRGATNYVPIKLHLVARTNGNGRITEQKAMTGVCKLNEYFAPMDMQFYLAGDFNYIDNDEMFDLEYPSVPNSVRFLYSAEKDPNAVNIFVGNGLSSGNSGYYTRTQDVIYMDKSYMNSIHSILAHEVGHYLSLAHTFFGWEGRSYDSSVPTPTRVNNGVLVEYVDRNDNCENAADRMCGTPADYINDWSGACNYTGGAVDPDSVAIDPEEANIMAYYSFRGCPEYFFSQDQMDAMTADFLDRKELSDVAPPVDQPVTVTPNLTSPQDQETINSLEDVVFSWEPTPNATRYLIEISPLSTFGIVEDRAYVTDNVYITSNLTLGRPKYYWRVSAFNNVHFCEMIESDSRELNYDASSTGVEDVSLKGKITILPNPASEMVSVQFFNNLNLSAVDISIFSVSGKKQSSVSNNQIQNGLNQLNVSISDLPKGVYLLSLESRGVSIGIEKMIKL